MTMGIRTITEMSKKFIAVLDSFSLNLVANYSKYRNKNVSNAAKALINFFRSENPKQLERKYRGR
jgi:protein SDA1